MKVSHHERVGKGCCFLQKSTFRPILRQPKNPIADRLCVASTRLSLKTRNRRNTKQTFLITSNGGCRREEKSRKHWSLFTMLLSLATDFFLLDQIKSNSMY